MRLKQLSLLASASLFGMLVHAGLSTSALAQAAAALTGTVTSAEEGPMEGVLVSAKKDGSTITVTVVTDAKGQYSFPADRLARRPLRHRHPGDRLRPRRAQGGRYRGRRLPRPTSSSTRPRTWSTSSPTPNGC